MKHNNHEIIHFKNFIKVFDKTKRKKKRWEQTCKKKFTNFILSEEKIYI